MLIRRWKKRYWAEQCQITSFKQHMFSCLNRIFLVALPSSQACIICWKHWKRLNKSITISSTWVWRNVYFSVLYISSLLHMQSIQSYATLLWPKWCLSHQSTSSFNYVFFIDLYLLELHMKWPMCASGSDVVGVGYRAAELTLACDWLLLCGPAQLPAAEARCVMKALPFGPSGVICLPDLFWLLSQRLLSS